MDLMVFALPAGILIGYAFGGRLKNLEKAELRGILLIFLAFLLRFLANSPDLMINTRLAPLNNYLSLINILAYLLLYFFTFLNWRYIGIKLFALAQTLNAIPILLNGGRMPFEKSQALKAGTYKLLISLYKLGAAIVPSNHSASFWYLGDWIILPGLRLPKLISIGDIALAFALCILIAELMKSNPRGSSEKQGAQKTQL